MESSRDTQVISDDKFLLVSDSNEVGNQFDSKKLKQSELVEMAQDKMFKDNLYLSMYLTLNQFNLYKSMIQESLDFQTQAYSLIEGNEWWGKFKVVEGQIILLDADVVDALGVSPLTYLKNHWHITQDFTVNQLKNCMLRGMTYIVGQNTEPIKRANNVEVGLTDGNLPPHMHHSGITSGANIESMKGGNTGDKSKLVQGNFQYDMFYNDSIAIGLDENEVQGVVDNFTVMPSGNNVSPENTTPKILHNNMPAYKRFYAFEVVRNTST